MGGLLLALSVGTQACSRPEPTIQNHSFARPDEVVMQHLDLDLRVDFVNQRLSGMALIEIDNRSDAAQLYLDTWALRISSVELDDGEEATFALGDSVPLLGRALIIDIRPETKRVTIHYETTQDARALQWLSPAQTRDGKHPFLYTQSQAIHARSWVPCQDVPSVRFSYHAIIQVPTALLALMSASNSTTKTTDGVYAFEMLQPIPAYLLALAVGDIEHRAISDRCGVYAEPSMVEAAAWEFADMERMMVEAEAMYGPYRWDRFDVIVLPPSFPFGGMENPRLTFATPILVAGDRSLVATIAHELAHSWSGNLVTNASWDDFWLNEGFTTYFERRIMERIYGRDVSEMHALLGMDDMREEIADVGERAATTALYVDLSKLDPDEDLGSAAYEKGYLFLRLLEESVGREAWDDFLRTYFDEHAFQSMTTTRFIDYLRDKLFAGDAERMRELRVDEWVFEPGLPSNMPQPQSGRFAAADAQIAAWDAGADASALQAEGWVSQEWDHFLTHIAPKMPAERMADLDATFHFAQSNGELQRSWYLLVIENEWVPGYAGMEEFLVTVGRRWLIRPLYAKLAESEWGGEFARRVYAQARPGYHALTTATMDAILEWPSGTQ
jgi:aminopeptidase N